jgi:hypothetical protein
MADPGGERVKESVVDLTATDEALPGPRSEGSDLISISGTGEASLTKGVKLGVQIADHAGGTASALKYLLLSVAATLVPFAWLIICKSVAAPMPVTLAVCGPFLLGGWIAILCIYLREAKSGPATGRGTVPPPPAGPEPDPQERGPAGQ